MASYPEKRGQNRPKRLYTYAVWHASWNDELFQKLCVELDPTFKSDCEIHPVTPFSPVQGLGSCFYLIKIPENEGKQMESRVGRDGFMVSPVMERVVMPVLKSIEDATLVEKRTLRFQDLSSAMFPEVDFSDSKNVKFLLFCCSILYRDRRIRRIVMANHELVDMTGFFQVKKMFGDLREISILKETAMYESVKKYMDSAKIKVTIDIPRLNQGVVVKLAPSEVIVPSYERTPDFRSFPAISMDISESPLHKFIAMFLRVSWRDVQGVEPFYTRDAAFSVSVDLHAPDRVLEVFKQFGRFSEGPHANLANVLYGGREIAAGQQEMFSGHFYASPQSCESTELSPTMWACVIRGVFQAAKDVVLGFDRALVVMLTPSGPEIRDPIWAISNDHIVLRKAN